MFSTERATSTSRTTYRVEVVGSAADIPTEAWDRLAPPDDPLYGQAFFRAMERGELGPDAYRYILLHEGPRIRAILPACVFASLSFGDIVGQGGRRALRPIERILGRSMRIQVLMCGHLLGEGRVLRDGDMNVAAARLLVAAVRQLATQLGLRWTVFKDFVLPDADWMRAALQPAGYFSAPGLPDAVLALRTGSFDDYLAALPQKARRNARSKLKKFAAHRSARLEVRERFEDLVPAMMPLYRAVLDRAETRLDVWTARFLTALSEDPRIPAKVVACWSADQLVGFLVCLFGKDTAVALRVGLDYGSSSDLRLYHVVHYRGIAEALGLGCQNMNFTQTAYEPKREMGCHLVPLQHAVTHRNPVIRAILRRFLPLALNQSGQQATGSVGTGPQRPREG